MVKKAVPRRMSGPGSKERGKTRSLLLDAGLALFSRKGFDGVAVGDLEEAVGLTPGSGSFYRHFADKEALLKAIMEREIEQARQRRSTEQDALVDTGMDIRVALARQFRLTLQGLRENAERINLLGRGADHFPQLKRELRKSLVQDALQAVSRAYDARIRAGELIAADPGALAAVVQSALYGYVSAEMAFGRPANPQAAEDALVDTLVQMLVREPATRPAGKAPARAAGKRAKGVASKR